MLHVANSAWATTDVMLSFWLTLFFLLLVRLFKQPDRRTALWAGIALGFCAGTKYTGAIVLIPLALLAFDPPQPPLKISGFARRLKHNLIDRHLLLVAATGLAVFLVTTPGILLHPAAFLASLRFENARLSQDYLPAVDPAVYGGQLVSLAQGMGWPLALAGLLGAAVALKRRQPLALPWVLMLAVYAIYLNNAMLPRYLIPLMPVLAIFAAGLFISLVETKLVWIRTAGVVLTATVCLYTFGYALAGVVARYPDTRSQAARFIESRIPPGASIGLGNISDEFVHLWRYPQIDFDNYLKKDPLKKPEYIVLSSYDYESIRRTLASGMLDPDYTLPQEYARDWYRYQTPAPDFFRLNEDLWLNSPGCAQAQAAQTPPPSGYCLWKKFEPLRLYAPIEFPPPAIEIYARVAKKP
jgi:hypothetical protein